MGSFKQEFTRAFIDKDRYMLFLEGLRNTLLLSVLAVFFGIIIGIVITFLNMNEFEWIRRDKPRRVIRRLSRVISGVYLDIIRGTPSFIQLLVMAYIVLAGVGLHKLLIAAIAFGINSGAYVSEIIRAGIQSVDCGQTEAGRSLGLTGFQTMRFIVAPQAIKNVLPTLANEFIVLIKETAVAGYIAVFDITKAAMVVQSNIYSATMPLLGAAVMYYVIIKVLSTFFRLMERRLKASEKGSAEA
jgi:His/Glu/Gln/Arg/opine family amino acid ABC transporter permease subunit